VLVRPQRLLDSLSSLLLSLYIHTALFNHQEHRRSAWVASNLLETEKITNGKEIPLAPANASHYKRPVKEPCKPFYHLIAVPVLRS